MMKKKIKNPKRNLNRLQLPKFNPKSKSIFQKIFRKIRIKSPKKKSHRVENKVLLCRLSMKGGKKGRN
jgi:hypothetical protein